MPEMEDLEEELMDLEENESVYLPDNFTCSRIENTSYVETNGLQKRHKTKASKCLNATLSNQLNPILNAVKQSHERFLQSGDDASTNSPFLRLFDGLSREEQQFTAQMADKHLTDSFQVFEHLDHVNIDEVEQMILQHFQLIFQSCQTGQAVVKPVSHSLGQIVINFATIFHSLYKQVNEDTATLEKSIKLAATDIHHFTSIMLSVLKSKYPFLGSYNEAVYFCLEEALFIHLQPTLHGLYANFYQEKDILMISYIRNISTLSLAEIGIPAIFRLDGAYKSKGNVKEVVEAENLYVESIKNYNGAIQCFDTIAYERSPSMKLRRLSKTCHSIDECIKDYYKSNQVEVTADKLNVTANDLAPILIFILSLASNSMVHIESYAAIMDEFIPSHLLTREEGYALTMLHAALERIKDMSSKAETEMLTTSEK